MAEESPNQDAKISGTEKGSKKDDDVLRFQNPSKACIKRIRTDLQRLYKDPVDGIFAIPDEEKVNVCHGLIIGPQDTPYEFGFFRFRFEFPNDYPHHAPRVTLQTTGGGVVRFNPNLYKNGKVCLSILGTWNGPSWSPVHTIGSILLSIRSLMNESPYLNEPGFEDQGKYSSESKNYNHCIRHETLRIAVIDMVELAQSGKLPEALGSLITSSFQEFAECFMLNCEEHLFLDGKKFQDPFHGNRGTFHFAKMRDRIERLNKELQDEG